MLADHNFTGNNDEIVPSSDFSTDSTKPETSSLALKLTPFVPDKLEQPYLFRNQQNSRSLG